MLSMDRGSRRLKSQVRSQGSSSRKVMQGNEDGVGHRGPYSEARRKGMELAEGGIDK